MVVGYLKISAVEQMNRVSTPGRRKRCFFSANDPYNTWGTTNRPLNGYRGRFPRK